MTKIYTVWTGAKFKGNWPDKEVALRYMATHLPDSAEWHLVEVDLAKTLDAEVKAMRQKIDAEEKERLAGMGTGVHRLKPVSVEASSRGRVN